MLSQNYTITDIKSRAPANPGVVSLPGAARSLQRAPILVYSRKRKGYTERVQFAKVLSDFVRSLTVCAEPRAHLRTI